MKLKSFIPFIACFFILNACNEMSDQQIEEWVKKNPDKILDAIIAHQKKQQEENQPSSALLKQYSSELFSEKSPSVGKGPVKIVYFFDFNCGHCKRQSNTMNEVISKAGDKVQIFYKNFAILGPSSLVAAKAALAAHQQGKYKAFYDEIHKTQDKSLESMKKIAQNLKLDVKKWEADLESASVKNELDQTSQLAEKMNINGTPFIAIAPDKVFPGRVDQLLQIVEKL